MNRRVEFNKDNEGKESANVVECDSNLIVMSACAGKCCDATHGFNWVVDS